MRRLFAIGFVIAALFAGPRVLAQLRQVDQGRPNSSGNAWPVTCVSGCSAGSSSTAADAMANPTAPQSLGYGMLFNGTTWDRQRGDTTNGLWVNCKTGCGSAAAVLMADGTANPTIPQNATFGLLYNGTTWDRWRGDSTNGAWVNIKSAPTITVTGTTTANIGTTGGLALDATLTGGTSKAIARGGAKGATAAADVTSENVDANTQALHVFIKNASIPVTGTFWQATQPVSGTITATQATGTNLHTVVDSAPTTAVTNAGLSNIPADPAREGGNLAAIAGKDFATSAKQDSGNASLSTIVTNTPALINGSQPVIVVSAPAIMPNLTQAQLSNPLLYRAAMQAYCARAICPPIPIGK